MSENFNGIADEILGVMEKHARELELKGVAVIIKIEDKASDTWDCRVRVVNSFTRGPRGPENPKDVGANLAAIAFSKAAEMADTLQNSGSGARPPIKGELGAKGGIIKRYKAGYILAAFSGGAGEQDSDISAEGLKVLERWNE